MTGDLNFPTPAPIPAIIQSDVTALSAAITAWGTKGSRDSHQDLVNLRGAKNVLCAATFLASSTKTSFIGTAPLTGKNYYFIIPQNEKESGVMSMVLELN